MRGELPTICVVIFVRYEYKNKIVLLREKHGIIEIFYGFSSNRKYFFIHLRKAIQTWPLAVYLEYIYEYLIIHKRQKDI